MPALLVALRYSMCVQCWFYLLLSLVLRLENAVLVKIDCVDLRFRSTQPGMVAKVRLQWMVRLKRISNRHKKFSNPRLSFIVHVYIKPFATQEFLSANLFQYVVI